MQLKHWWREARSPRALKIFGLVVGAVLLFGVGVLTGDGRLRVLSGSPYHDQTGLPKTLDYSSLTQVYDALRSNYNGKLTEDQLLSGLKHGLADATNDPYTEYFTPAEAKAFNGELQGISLTGIGAELDQDSSGNIVVMSPLDGSPAAAAGLKAKDIITSINSESTAGMSVNTAVGKIRGPKGSTVTLVINRRGQQLTFTITRDTITVPTATSKILAGDVGYLQISQFSSDTYSLAQAAATKFQQAGVKKVILDLRDDPGGEVTTAQDIASMWLKDGALIEQEKRGSQVIDGYRATGNNPLLDMPTVVLVNAGSASAAEITALALRDNGAAVIYGEKSYGKGVVQQVIPFTDGSELKVTIAKWYGPKDTSINHKGITPDKTVSQSDADTASGVDAQLQAAQDYLQGK
ncbi:MAG TPA: S41 family peptidase [Candidatus Saccharimonadales bacterium]|nr:S41 family peptidase [Candidatus Saccharimonadales bacterium]